MGDLTVESNHQVSPDSSPEKTEYNYALGPTLIPGSKKSLNVCIYLDGTHAAVVEYVVRHDRPDIHTDEIVCKTYRAAVAIYNAI